MEQDSTLKSTSRQKNIWTDTRHIMNGPSGEGSGTLRGAADGTLSRSLSVLVQFTAFMDNLWIYLFMD